MKEENFFERNKKNGILFVAVFSALFLGAPFAVFAEEVATSTRPVTFTVTVGKISCENGKGSASVILTNDPIEGGYYEVYGEMITKNNITLSRTVALPTGTYTWQGFANSGYVVSGKSSGEFTVGKCSLPEATAQTIKTPEPPSLKFTETIPEKNEVPNIVKENLFSTSSPEETATTSDANALEDKTFIVIGLLLLAAIFAFVGFRNKVL
ncbi:MAG: hypothetical protein WC878_01530 [Candidatus Paceibacterota bacterium]|jgi:hypothetical protein